MRIGDHYRAIAPQRRITRNNQWTAAFGNAELAMYGKSVQQAVDFYIVHLRAMEKSVSVADAMEALISARRAAAGCEGSKRLCV